MDESPQPGQPSLTQLLDDLLPLVRWMAEQTPDELIEARLRQHKARMAELAQHAAVLPRSVAARSGRGG